MLSNCLAWKRRKSSKINKPARMGSMEKIRRIASRSGSGQSVCSNTQKMEDEQSMDHPSAPPAVAAEGSARPIRMLDERSSSLFSVQAKIDRQEANRNRAQALFSQVDQQMEIQHKFNGRRPSSGIIDSSWYCSRWDENIKWAFDLQSRRRKNTMYEYPAVTETYSKETKLNWSVRIRSLYCHGTCWSLCSGSNNTEHPIDALWGPHYSLGNFQQQSCAELLHLRAKLVEKGSYTSCDSTS